MFKKTILCVPRNEAICHAGERLSRMGFEVVWKAAPDVSHVLLPVPSFSSGDEYLAHILADLPDDVIISGGNLSSPLLKTYTVIDFLQDPYYLAENAAITASCALQIVKSKISKPLSECQALVIGWGRIGKCLCRLFEKEGTSVSVAARKIQDRAMIRALGSRGISIDQASGETDRYDIILNTVPVMLLPDLMTKEGAVVLELASMPGMSGERILNCRGLPGKMAPDISGELIVRTFTRLSFGKEI